MSVCNISFVDLLLFSFDVFGGVCRENSCNVYLTLSMHGTLGFYFRDALQEGSDDVVACFHVPRA
jgi:hypothetical protein